MGTRHHQHRTHPALYAPYAPYSARKPSTGSTRIARNAGVCVTLIGTFGVALGAGRRQLMGLVVGQGVMILTAFIASLVPALRALRVDPISALRGE